MILDKLENADWYYDSVPGLKEFMKFYNDNDLEEMPDAVWRHTRIISTSRFLSETMR